MKRTKSPNQGSLFDLAKPVEQQRVDDQRMCICGHKHYSHKKGGRGCMAAGCRCPKFEVDE